MKNRPARSILPLLCAATLLPLAAAVARGADSYRFVVLADSRSSCQGTEVNSDALGAVFDSIGRLDPAPRFVFFTGDLVCGRSDQRTVQAAFDDWVGVIRSAAFPLAKVYPVFGGHERVVTGAGDTAQLAWSAFGDYFDPVAQSGVEGGEPAMSCRYYDPGYGPPDEAVGYSHTAYLCDFGEDRFFVLNNDCIPPSHSQAGSAAGACAEHELGCGQFNWVRYHLVGNGRRHNFFFHHEPMFGVGAHQAGGLDDATCPRQLAFVMDAKSGPRNDYARLLGYHNGTTVFSGHEHHYTYRYITHELIDRSLAADGAGITSLAFVIEADPVGQAAGPATAFSLEGAISAGQPARAPLLKLWWSSRRGKPDWKGRVRRAGDDAEELVQQGGVPYLESSDLELMRDPAQGEQSHVALRFTDIPIPPAAVIQKARLQLTAKRDSASGPRVRIRLEATPFAAAFSRCAADLSRRPTTTAGKVWEVGPWTAGRRYQTPNLARPLRSLLRHQAARQEFPLGYPEIKTGSAGAPWYARNCRAFMGNVLHEVIDPAGYATTPYHYAVVDVDHGRVQYRVYSWDGTLLPGP